MFSLARTVLFGFFHWISASTAQLLSGIHPGAKLIRLTHRTTAVAKHFAQYSAVMDEIVDLIWLLDEFLKEGGQWLLPPHIRRLS